MDVLYICAFLTLTQVYASSACSFPGAPAHCRVSFSDDKLTEGTYASYECERGFELLGPSRRMCGADGKWTPDGIPFCVLNVAAGKAPMQMSTEGGGVPQRALDGSTAATFSPETCTLTRPATHHWWYVNLLEPYMVQLVRLDFGKPCCDSNKPAVIVVRVGNNRPDLGTNPICNRFTGFIEEGQPLFLPCNPPMPGAFVSVHLEAPSPAQLSICEAFVYTDQALPVERCPQFRDQPPGSTATYNGKCYIFYSREGATFGEALEACRARGGTLIDESNPALQGFISWELWRRHRSDSSSQYWLGAVRDPQDPSEWRWVNGNEVTVSFWNAPSTGRTQHCARFDGSNGWLWADTDCHATLNYICQHQPRACGRPEQPPNSTMVGEGFEVGASVHYTCDEGHLLVGPTVRTCLDTGFYDEFPPVCKRIECGLPAGIAHGGYSLVNGSVSYLAQVQYTCEPGYQITGRSRLVCDIDQRWNGPPPRCDVVQCEEPPGLLNGRVRSLNNSVSYGAVVEYTCARGYRLQGAARARCLHTGLWDQPVPFCQAEERPSTTSAAPTTSSSSPPSTPRLVLPPRPSSPTPFVPAETRRPRPKTTTERPTTAPPHTRPPHRHESPATHVPHIIVATHPRENQIIGGGNNIRAEQTPRVSVPTPVEGERAPAAGAAGATGARLNIGAVVALAAFGALVFLIAIITTIVILVRSRRQSEGQRYRQQRAGSGGGAGSPDGSSSSESRSGLNRFYRQAWEELHSAAAARRAEGEPPRDHSELVVSEAYGGARDKRRHHHHHHRDRHQWRPAPHHTHHAHHTHKPRY